MKQKANQTIAFIVGIFLLFIGTDIYAQLNAKTTAGDPAASVASSKNQRYLNAMEELRNFKHDESNRTASQMHYNLLRERMNLEKELMDNSIQKSRVIEINHRLEVIEKQIKNGDFSVNTAIKQMMVTDHSYINYNGSDLEFISLEDFKKLTPEKQNVIATNSGKYRIVENNEMLPKNSYRKVDTESGDLHPTNVRLQNLSKSELEARGKIEEKHKNNFAEETTTEYDVVKHDLNVIINDFKNAEASGKLTQDERQAYLNKIAVFEAESARLKQIYAPEKPQSK